MGAGKLIIVSAPSGAGKTTIVRQLLESELPLEFSVSACSRDQRGEEVNGVDYHFLGLEGFKNAIKEEQFLEWEEVYPDQFYGTLHSEVERIWKKGNAVIFDIDVIGGLNLKEKFGKDALSVFIMPPSTDVLEARLRSRKTESEEKINMRIGKASQELSRSDEFDTVVVNKVLDVAVKETHQKIQEFLNKG